VTTLGVFRLHLSVLLPYEWWGRIFLNHYNLEAVLNKQQHGDSPRTAKQTSALKLTGDDLKWYPINLEPSWNSPIQTLSSNELSAINNEYDAVIPKIKGAVHVYY